MLPIEDLHSSEYRRITMHDSPGRRLEASSIEPVGTAVTGVDDEGGSTSAG
jgi:hypothetical protein